MTALYILFPLDNIEIINSESNTNAEQYFLYMKVSHRCICLFFSTSVLPGSICYN